MAKYRCKVCGQIVEIPEGAEKSVQYVMQEKII